MVSGTDYEKAMEYISAGYYFPDKQERKSLVEEIENAEAENLLALVLTASFRGASKIISVEHKKQIVSYLSDYARKLIDLNIGFKVVAVSFTTSPWLPEGTLDYLRMNSRIPKIMNDLIIDEKQLGMSDVVVLRHQLCGENLEELIDRAHELEQEVLLEISSHEDFEFAKKSEADAFLVVPYSLYGIAEPRVEAFSRFVPSSSRPMILSAELPRGKGFSPLLTGSRELKSYAEGGLEGLISLLKSYMG